MDGLTNSNAVGPHSKVNCEISSHVSFSHVLHVICKQLHIVAGPRVLSARSSEV